MKFRKSWKRFWTLDRHHSDGFTLVELIVVIAILAILAGVGTVGYSGYIKSANKNADITTINQIVRAVHVAGNSYSTDISVEQVSSEGLQVPVGLIIISDQMFSYNSSSDTISIGSGSYTNILLPEGETVNAGKLEEILSAAFGRNYGTDVKLLSSTWKDTNVPALYADAQALFSQIQTMSNLLYNNQSLISDKLNKTYTSSVEVVSTIAAAITGTFTEDQFVQKWIAANGKGTQYAFDLNSKGMEVYTAVRAGYNEAVASYIEKMAAGTHQTYDYDFGKSISIGKYTGGEKCELVSSSQSATTHSKHIRSYSESLSVGDLIVSDTIQSSLFATFNQDGTIATYGSDTHGGSKKSIVWIGNAGYLPDGTQLCSTCAGLVANYCASNEAKEDARAFYKTMKTIDDTADEAIASGDGWGYYNDYVSDFASLYDSLDNICSALTQNGSAIVVTVYYDSLTKMLTTNVSVSLD